MKKKIIIVFVVIVLLMLLVPIPLHLLDGGTIEYKALLYKVSKVHSLTSIEEREGGKQYNEGIIIEILGFEIYNSVKWKSTGILK